MGRRARKRGVAPTVPQRRHLRTRTAHVTPIVVWGMDGQGTHGIGIGAAGDKIGIGIHERTPQGKPVQRQGEGAMLSLKDVERVLELVTLLKRRIEAGEDTAWRDEDFAHLVSDGSD